MQLYAVLYDQNKKNQPKQIDWISFCVVSPELDTVSQTKLFAYDGIR
jgi:hypothetical protein